MTVLVLGATASFTSGCGNVVSDSPKAPAVDNLTAIRVILEKISANGQDKKSVGDLGMAFPMALIREKETVEPIVPLYEKLKSTSKPEDRKKLATEMLEKINSKQS